MLTSIIWFSIVILNLHFMKLFTHISIIYCCLVCCCSVGVSQTNLVVNPSFEDTVVCPTADNQVYNALNWDNYSDQSPDYFNSCTSNIDIDVPNNWGGYQVASSGDAYCAVSAFFLNTPNKREIIGSNLLSNMIIGTKYYFSMKINLSINSIASSSYACNNLGIRFSTVPYSVSNPTPINNFAHIWTDSIITDTLNWATIFGSFVADSAYSYLALGNFFDDVNTDTSKIANGTPTFIFAYYYIDDVCVSTDSSYTANYIFTGIEEEHLKNNFDIYPNPVTNYFHINQPFTESYDLVIYNTLGQQLYEEKNITTGNKIINTTQFTKGLLLITIKSNTKSINYKLLKL